MHGSGAAASYGDLLVTSLVVLLVVCAAGFAIVKLVGRFAGGRTRGAGVIEIIARTPLEPRRALCVVEVGGKTLLIGTSELGVTLLTELDGGEVRARAVEAPGFAELVRAAWARRRAGPIAKGAKDDVS